jgi:preprotein translocase subunit SecD
MEKKRAWRLILVGLIVAFCILYIMPSLVGTGKMPSWYPFTKELNYGLDLKGGLELRYGVDYKKAILETVRDLMIRTEEYLARGLAKKSKEDEVTPADLAAVRAKVTMDIVSFDTLKVDSTDEALLALLDGEKVRDDLDARFDRLDGEGNSVLLRMKDNEAAGIKDRVVTQTLSIIRKRVDAFGLVEPDVRRNGDSAIDVQLPGVSKGQMDMVRDKIGQTARLTFRIVDNKSDFFAGVQDVFDAFKASQGEKGASLAMVDYDGRKQVTADKKSLMVGFMRELIRAKKLPADHTIGFYEVEEKGDGGAVARKYFRTEYLFAEAKVSGDHLTRAQVFYKESGEPYVSLEFNSLGAKMFEEVTAAHVNDYMAVMLDEDINSAPVIKERIGGGRAQITLGGSRSPQELLAEAQSMVTVLTHGAYKAPVHKIHDNQVGPSLGKDTIDAGVLSFIVGFLAVIFFMAIYYKASGLVADLALFINLVIMLAVLVGMNSALTMPGIAGIVLTMGMAVDSNVIIYERSREEIRLGKTPRACIEAGFDRAFWTIMDSQLTTALAALILLNFTTGPIYGFGITLLVGIICSVGTAFGVTKLIFYWMLDRRIIKDTISI